MVIKGACKPFAYSRHLLWWRPGSSRWYPHHSSYGGSVATHRLWELTEVGHTSLTSHSLGMWLVAYGPQLGDEAGFRAVESWVFNISCPNCNDEQSNGLRRARDEIESSGCDFAGALVSAFDDLMSQGRIGIATYRDVGGDHGPLAHRSGLGYDIEFGTDMWGDGPPQRFPEWTWENTLNVVAHELTHHIYTNLFGETCSRSNGGCHDDPPADGWPTVHEVAEDCGGLAWSNDDGGDYHAN